MQGNLVFMYVKVEIIPFVVKYISDFSIIGLVWVEALRPSQQFFSHVGTDFQLL